MVTFKTLMNQAPSPNIISAQSRSILYREKANKNLLCILNLELASDNPLGIITLALLHTK
jgi:hypothetical protein